MLRIDWTESRRGLRSTQPYRQQDLRRNPSTFVRIHDPDCRPVRLQGSGIEEGRYFGVKIARLWKKHFPKHPRDFAAYILERRPDAVLLEMWLWQWLSAHLVPATLPQGEASDRR